MYFIFYLVYEMYEQTKKVLVFVFRLKEMVLSKNVLRTIWNTLRLVFISVCDVFKHLWVSPFLNLFIDPLLVILMKLMSSFHVKQLLLNFVHFLKNCLIKVLISVYFSSFISACLYVVRENLQIAYSNLHWTVLVELILSPYAT